MHKHGHTTPTVVLHTVHTGSTDLAVVAFVVPEEVEQILPDRPDMTEVVALAVPADQEAADLLHAEAEDNCHLLGRCHKEDTLVGGVAGSHFEEGHTEDSPVCEFNFIMQQHESYNRCQ